MPQSGAVLTYDFHVILINHTKEGGFSSHHVIKSALTSQRTISIYSIAVMNNFKTVQCIHTVDLSRTNFILYIRYSELAHTTVCRLLY